MTFELAAKEITAQKKRAVTTKLDSDIFLRLLQHCAKRGYVNLSGWVREAIMEKMETDQTQSKTKDKKVRIINDDLLAELIANHQDFPERETLSKVVRMSTTP